MPTLPARLGRFDPLKDAANNMFGQAKADEDLDEEEKAALEEYKRKFGIQLVRPTIFCINFNIK